VVVVVAIMRPAKTVEAAEAEGVVNVRFVLAVEVAEE
jgi:hypothetical protein